MRRALLGIGLVGPLLFASMALGALAPAGADPVFGRQSGLDRYGTAAAVSSVAYPTGSDVVFLASGTTFPDALAGGPYAAAVKAPILLVTRDTLPNATAEELDRLNPKQIVVLGGTSAVSDPVLQATAKYASVEVRRIAGTDRYDTAAQVSNGFTAPLTTVYIASGQGFADALTGGPAIAGTTGGPLLLVQKDAIPTATADALTRLKPSDIIVLGGPSSISDAVFQKLNDYAADPVLRKAGSDRYDTAVQVSGAFPTAPKVFLASGAQFPDALTGGAVAGAGKGPVLLVQKDCIPFNVDIELTRLKPTNVIVLGGESSVGPGVMSRTVC